ADAREMAGIVGVRYDEIPVDPVFSAFLTALAHEFEGRAVDAAEENIQARIRGTLLMALSNKFGSIVLTTGNKSEMAVGYATLYGDMAGGFAVLKDISKTLVYRLCRYRNGLGRVIPERIITRAPSAEVRADPGGQDSAPPPDALRRRSCGPPRSTRIRCRPTMRSTASSKRTSSRTSVPRRSSRWASRRSTYARSCASSS